MPSGTAEDTVGPAELRRVMADHRLGEKRLLIVVGPQPQSLVAAAILCRAAVRKRVLVHTTFLEPVVGTHELETLLADFKDHDTVMIGVKPDGKFTLQGECIVIGAGTGMGSAAPQTDSISAAAATYVIAHECFGTGKGDIGLAAMGIVIEHTHAPPTHGVDAEIVSSALAQGELELLKGFRLYGTGTLSVVDALYHCISPWLPGISGKREQCEAIIADANLPFVRRTLPILQLSREEKQKVTMGLVQHLDSEKLSQLLGTDYLARFMGSEGEVIQVSDIYALLRTAWTRRRLGLGLAVLIGDLKSAQQELRNLHVRHCKDVIAHVDMIQSALEATGTLTEGTTITEIEINGIDTVILSDLGRIALETNTVTSPGLLLRTNQGLEQPVAFVWRPSVLTLQKVLKAGMVQGIAMRSTSDNSVSLRAGAEPFQRFHSMAENLLGGKDECGPP